MDNRFAPQHKLAASPRLTEYLKGNHITPINVEISLVGYCNAQCPFCFYAQPVNPLPGWDKAKLDYNRVLSLYDEFAQMEVKAITYTGGGDSSLHPNIKEIVEKAHSVGLQQGFITNALKVAYDPTLLEWVRISLTNKPLPVDNIKILRACKTLGININYGGDEEEVKRTLEVAHKVGADYVEVRPALNLNGQLTNIEPPKVTDPLLKIIHYKFEEAKKPHGYTKCQGYHFVPFIWQTGDVDVCAYHYGNKAFNLGNINNQSFTQIMINAPKYVDVIPQCQVCCYSKDTLVPFKEEINSEIRLDTIENINKEAKLGQLVYSYNKETGKSEWKPIIAHQKIKESKILELDIYNCPVTKVSLDHEIEIYSNGLLKTIQARDLKVGDMVPICSAIHDSKIAQPVYPNLSYIFGYHLGDGCVTKRRADTNIPKEYPHVEFAFGKQADLFFNKVKQELENNKIEYKEYYNKDYMHTNNIRLNGFWGKEIIELFGGQFSDTKKIPNSYITNSLFSRQLVCGLIDSDGYVTKDKIRIRLNNKYMIHQIGLILSLNSVSYNIYSIFHTEMKKFYWELSVSNPFDFNRLKSLFKDSLKLNKVPFKELDANYRRRLNGTGFFLGDIQIAKVKKISIIDYNDWTYDFTVQDNHTFLVNNKFFGNNCKLHESNKLINNLQNLQDINFV
jgi:MoaA/NifB/PqqE/SkfB family radical SAM enzyme